MLKRSRSPSPSAPKKRACLNGAVGAPAAPAAPDARIQTIVGNRKAGSRARAAEAGPMDAPEETGILLSGTVCGLWMERDGRLAVLTHRTGQCSVMHIEAVAPFKRVRADVHGASMYLRPMVLVGDEMYFDNAHNSGVTAAATLRGPYARFADNLRTLMTVADRSAGYLIGLGTAKRLRVVRLTADGAAEWEHGQPATEPWSAALAELLGPLEEVFDWQIFARDYECLRRIFAAAHQQRACFEEPLYIGLHLNNYPGGSRATVSWHNDGAYRTSAMRTDELPGLALPGVVCSLSQRGHDGDCGEGPPPAANLKHNRGMVLARNGCVYWIEALCLRHYKDHYAPFGSADGATELPALPNLDS